MGKFVIYRKNTGYDFHLKAANGETIGTSEIYTKKDACVDGIESVIRCAEAAEIEDQTVRGYLAQKNPKFEIYQDQKGGYCFRLLEKSGQMILESQAYTAKASCRNGIRSVKVNVPRAEVEMDEIQ